jgi:SpoVK/Ycf46/Vps4 family AAA+-type ATPase
MARKRETEEQLKKLSPSSQDGDKQQETKQASKADVSGFEFHETVPDREIFENHVEVSVVSETKNHQRKSFDTLYLREQDSNQLKQAMDLFLNQKDTMLDLGLPYKFAALLYGLPGAGKTSSAYAIASYLNQSINYVDLSGVETNQELQMIFDHVHKHSDGGIIVIE